MSIHNQSQLEYRQYNSEFLRRDDDVVAHASKLYSAGSPRFVFKVDDEEPSVVEKIILFPLFLIGHMSIKKTNPHTPFLKRPRYGRNKLMVFDEWLIRCTYQQYVQERSAELFYYSGIPLRDIESITWPDDNTLMVFGDSRDLGGPMYAPKSEREGIRQALNELKRDGRLQKANMKL